MTAGRKRILFLIPSLRGGGAERFFSILLRHLDRTSFEPHLALLRAEGEYLRDLPDDVVVHDLECSRARYAPPGLLRLIWKLRPQAVLSTSPQTNMALTLSAPFLPHGTRVLLSESNMPSAELEDGVAHPRLWAWLYRHLYKRADKVVCLCDAMMDDLALHFNVPREKLTRIYYPVDLERVRELADSQGNPFAGPGPHLAAAGRLCRQKGFDLLLAAMSRVRAHLPQASLTILGQGPLLAELTRQAKNLGLTDAVRLLGFQQNPWPYIKHADVFVLSSRYEGLPNVLLEALALGTPIVATDCPSAIRELHAMHPEIVMVPPEDPEALAQGILARWKTQFENAVPRPSGSTVDGLSEFSLPQVVGEYSKLLLSK
jgi:glycosyltransferase involved in cell wall biosynthesis